MARKQGAAASAENGDARQDDELVDEQFQDDGEDEDSLSASARDDGDVDVADDDTVDDGDDDEEIAADTATSQTAKESMRQQLAADVEAFLAAGGQIQEVPHDYRADPPKKPENNYGRGSI